MAIKPFAIQGADLTLGGVNLQAGTTGVVIPGVTQATSYTVEEVNDTGDQTFSNFPPDTEGDVVVIDAALYDTIVAQGDERHFADYTVTTDGEGYIDEIQVNGQGAYTGILAGQAQSFDMYAYTGTGSASDRPLVPQDWIQIPFRPKMRAGAIETIGGGGAGVVERSVNYPLGESGDTQGTLANDNGTLYFCYQDFVGTDPTVITAINSSDGSGSGQQYDDATFDLSDGDNSDISDFVAANWNLIQNGNGMSTEVSVDGGDTWFSSVGVSYYPSDTPPTFSVSYNQVNQPQPGDEVEVRFTAITQEIWLNISNSGSASLGYLSVDDYTLVDRDETDNFISLAQGSNHLRIATAGEQSIYLTTNHGHSEPYSSPQEGANTWEFDSTGALKFPDGSVQTTAYTGPPVGTFLLHEYADPAEVTTPTVVTIDGMDYGNGNIVNDGAFGPNSSRVTLYADSIFAIVAVNADIETVYYNGETGSDGDGDKTVSSNVISHRGYYARRNLIRNDDPAISQIVISKSSSMIATNRTEDTNNDDFTVSGLTGSNTIVILNVYWNSNSGPDYNSSINMAVTSFIDNVLFDVATDRMDLIGDMRTAFYATSSQIKSDIENEEGDFLYGGFEFYNTYKTVEPTGGAGTGAVLEIQINPYSQDYNNPDVLVAGTGYLVSDTLTVLGELVSGTTPTNNVTITVTSVNADGGITDWTVTGTPPSQPWPASYIIDGDSDQYDIGNFIGTNRTRVTATVTLEYQGGASGDDGNTVFPTLTVLSADKPISVGQWVWFSEDNSGAFINWEIPTIASNTLVNGDQTFTLNSDGSITFPDGSIQTTAYTGSGAADNVWIQTFVTATPATDVVQIATSVEYDSAGNIVSLFSHYDPSDNSTYYSVGKYTTTGTRIWTTRFGAEFNTDGWGLAVDSTSGFVYIAGKTNTDGGQIYSTLTKISGVDGTIEWSKLYDFGFNSSSAVVDVDPDGNPVMVGYASNGDDRYVTTTKVDAADGTIIWSRALDGQGDDDAYGMAVGPSGEIVTVGYMSQLVSPLANSVATAVTEPVSNVNWVTNTNVFTNGVNFNVTFNAGVPTIVINSDSEGDWTVGNTIGTILGSLVGGTDGIDDMVVKVDTVVTDTDARMLVVKYANNGTIAWQKAVRFDTGYDSFGADADIDSEGNIYVCGMYENDLGGPFPQSMSIVKFNSSGVKQWSRRVDGNCGGWTSSIVVGPDDKLYLSATTFSGDNPGNADLHTVVAKYEFDGTVAWQRLLDYTEGASLGSYIYETSSGGSNLAVKQDYVAVGLGFSSDISGGPGTFHAAVAQLPVAGDLFAVGSWDFKAASFSGTLSSDASQIEVVNSTKTDFDNASNIDTTTVTPDFDSGEFLIGTVFTNATSDADLVGNGHQASIGYKYTVYTDSQGYQGGENTGVILKDNLSHPYTVGDLITFRNGEQKSITSVQTGYGDTWVQWSGPVDGGDSNPRFPITVQSSIYTPETKPTARIKPDLGEAIAHDQYMKIYAGSSGNNPTDPGTPSVMDSLHIHMAGAQENVELFLGTDANYVSTKETGLTPAGVRLHSEVDVSVVNTNLRLDRKGSTWVSVYGDGENKNLYNNGYDLSWSTIAVDDYGDYYVGGEDNSYATAIINKYSRDGQLLWSKYNDGADYNGWQFDGVAYHNGQVATLVQTATGRVNDYYKLSVLDSSTGDLISTTDIYDPDGNLEAHSMIHHSTLGWTVVGNTEGEVGTTAAITDTNNPNDYDAIRLLASACLIDGRYPANGQGWRITGTNITGGQNFNTGVGFFQNRPVVAVTGTGVDAYATVYIDYNANTYNMDVVTSVGSGFAIGDTVKILGSQLGGVDGVNDFTFTCQSNGGLNSYDNYAGTPSRQYIWIDMNVAGGYVDTAFKDGTFTLTRRRSNRPWIWTNEWTRFLNPTPISSDPYAGGQAFCVAEDPLTHDLVVGGYIDTFDNSGTFVWKLNDAGATQWAKTINSDNSSVRGIAVSGLDSSIYVSTNYIYVHKLSSSGDLTKTVSNYGMWGVSQPEIKLAIEEDGFEYVYVGGSGSAIWSITRNGFFLNKLTTDLVTVWGRGMWHTEDDLSIDYDIEHTNFVLGKGQASLVGFGNPYSLDNTNALIYTISTGDQFEPVDVLGWQAIQNGGQVWNTDTGLSMYNIITAGAQAVTATALTETQTDSLSWTNYAFQSKLINLNTVKRGIVGVETIEFNDGGTLDHNPADIPPSVLFDPSNSGWEYTLQLSDRGRFILNQTVPNDSICQDLYVYVPRNDQVAFPVGTVITLINASSAEAGGQNIYVRPINYADGNGWVRIWAVGGNQNPSQWRFQGIQTATLMKISTNGWLLTANNIINDD